MKNLLLLSLFATLALPAIAQDKAAPAKYDIPATDDGLPGAGPIRRYDWFKNLWVKKRSAWDQPAEREKSQGAIVFLGDSITQGWGDDFKNSFAGLKTANRGISGDTTRGMLIRLEADVLLLKPKAVVLLMGTNDLEEGAAPEVVADNLKLIVAALKKHRADMPIVLCQVMPSSATKKRPADAIKKINELYAAAVKGDPQITVPSGDIKFLGPLVYEENYDKLPVRSRQNSNSKKGGKIRIQTGFAAEPVRREDVRAQRREGLEGEGGRELYSLIYCFSFILLFMRGSL